MVSVCLTSLEKQQSSNVGISGRASQWQPDQHMSMLLLITGTRVCCQWLSQWDGSIAQLWTAALSPCSHSCHREHV